MDETSTIGDRLRRLRGQRGMTQEELAAAAGVSREIISKLENGQRTTARLSTVSKLADGLDVEIADLVNRRDHLRKERDGGSVRAVRDALLDPRLLPGFDADDSDEQAPDGELERSVTEAWRRYRAGEFGELLAMIPGLIGEGRVAYSAHGGSAVQSLAQAYEVASALMTQIGRTDLGLIAAERAVTTAHSGDDELLWAWMHAAYSWVLFHQARYQEAEHVVTRIAERIEPGFRDDDKQMAVWGNLLLCGVAPIVAQDRDPGEHLRLSAASAERLGRRVEMYRSWFDAPSVAMQATYGYSRLRKPGKALDAAKRVRPGDLWGISWGAHLMDVAQANVDAGHHQTAIRALLEAREISPVWFRHQPVARGAVEQIREIESRLSPQVRSLARSLSL